MTIDYFTYHPDRSRMDKQVFKGDISSFEISRLHLYPREAETGVSDEKFLDGFDTEENHKCLLMEVSPVSLKRRFSKLKSFKGVNSVLGDSVRQYVSKVVLSSGDEFGIIVEIDGERWEGVKFISASPQWGGRVRSFNVSIS
jgi:hypothetical protein